MLVRAPTMLVTALVMALIISTRLSQVFLVVIALLVIAGVVIVIKRVGPFFTSLQGATDELNLVVQEDLNAIRVVKSFVREAQEKEKFTQRSEKLRSMAERAFGFVVLFMPVMMVLMGGTITAIMWIGGMWIGGLEPGGREPAYRQRGHGRHFRRYRQRQDHPGEPDPRLYDVNGGRCMWADTM